MLTELRWQIAGILRELRELAREWAFDEKRAAHSVAAGRIGLGLALLGLLLTNFATRGVWIGPGALWVEQTRLLSTFPEIRVLSQVSGDVITVVYLVAIAAALAFMLGWRTKAANVILLIAFIGLIGQNPVAANQTDNLVRLALLWYLLMDSAHVWSLDARRRDLGLTGRSEDVVPSWFSTSLHNLGLAGLGIQTVLIYMAAGFDKIADPVWRNGTALAYTLRLPDHQTVGWLSEALVSTALLTAVLTFAVLVVQVYFAPLMITRPTRVLVLLFAVAVNLLFALLFAQPWDSLVVIAITLVLMPADLIERWFETARYSVVGDRLAEAFYAVADRIAAVSDRLRYDVFARIGDGWRYRIWYPVADRLRAIVRR